MSDLIAPALAYPFEEKRLKKGTWIAEQKWDGHRMLACTVGGNAPICWSRGLKIMGEGGSQPVPEHIRAALRGLPPAIVDGELVEVGDDGKSFGVSHARANATAGARLRYVVFDILNLRGVDLCGCMLMTRIDAVRELLEKLDSEYVLPSLQLGAVTSTDDALALAQPVWDRGGEGLIVKDTTGLYRPGKRMQTWMKLKRLETAVLTLIGFEEGLMGPCSIAVLRDADGAVTTVKWKNLEWLATMNAEGEKHLGRRVRIEFTERTAGSYREPRWDRWEDE